MEILFLEDLLYLRNRHLNFIFQCLNCSQTNRLATHLGGFLLVSTVTEPHLLAPRNPHTSQQHTGTEPASVAEFCHHKAQPHASFIFYTFSPRKTMPYSLLFCVTNVRLGKKRKISRLKPLMLRHSLKFGAAFHHIYYYISYQLPEEVYHIHMQQKLSKESWKTSDDSHLASLSFKSTTVNISFK